MTRKIVLAYSGGLDTSVILKWLKEKYQCPVVAFIADIGQGEDIGAISRKAARTGADKVHVADLREEFARDYVFAALKANAVYEGAYLMGTSIARPLIAKYQVKVAKSEGADAVAHGATGKGNDQVRFELTVKALAPELEIIAPWRIWDFKGRNDLFAYAEKHGIELPVTREKPYSMDANLMHISYEGGILEDPWNEPPADMFQMTQDPSRAPDAPEYVEIEFADGVPTALNREALSPAKLVLKLNEIAGRHGVGRVDVVENRFIGMKSRGVYETPGVTVLHLAHRAVESLTMDREVMHLRDMLMPRFAELVYNGFWFSPEMNVLRAFIDESQKGVHGTARVKLYKGHAAVVGRKSPNSLYNPEIASFETFGTYNSKDAEGFIRMNGLRLSLNKALRKFLQ
ncbi:MAG TPA: argininosuccinate synthase [Planctomycetota bacterium]|jgi:argininosuccinate synthase|nr:argininosuccinate synthase [Planctomycetota bacterium]